MSARVQSEGKEPRPAGNLVPEQIGIIGVGLMGMALAERLLAGGFGVLGWDINPARGVLLTKLGGSAAKDAREVVTHCNRVFLSLPDIEVVESVLSEVSLVLRAGQIIIDTTTSDPERTAAVGNRLAEHGVFYQDATISGSSAQLRERAAISMVGGTRKTFENCQDLFGLFSKRAVWTGQCGSGSRMKLVTNLVLGLNRAALAEGLALARGLQLDLELTLDILMESMAYSRIMETKGVKMVNGDFDPQARLSQHLKDVRLILHTGASAGTHLPLTHAQQRLLESAESAGFGQLDNSAIIRAFDPLPKTSDGK